MNSTTSHPKKLPASQARRKPERLVAALCQRRPRRSQTAATKTALRREFRVFRESLPTALERDTLLTPEWVAESVVQEVERFLKTKLPRVRSPKAATSALLLRSSLRFHRCKHSACCSLTCRQDGTESYAVVPVRRVVVVAVRRPADERDVVPPAAPKHAVRA